MIKVGIIRATGYAGEQLVWILHNHPNVNSKILFLIIMQIFRIMKFIITIMVI